MPDMNQNDIDYNLNASKYSQVSNLGILFFSTSEGRGGRVFVKNIYFFPQKSYFTDSVQ